jgi:hypothetical protein
MAMVWMRKKEVPPQLMTVGMAPLSVAVQGLAIVEEERVINLVCVAAEAQVAVTVELE